MKMCLGNGYIEIGQLHVQIDCSCYSFSCQQGYRLGWRNCFNRNMTTHCFDSKIPEVVSFYKTLYELSFFHFQSNKACVQRDWPCIGDPGFIVNKDNIHVFLLLLLPNKFLLITHKKERNN